MKFTVVIFPGEDGWVIAKCPVLPGCISQGRTREEAMENIKEAIAGCVEVRKDMGWPPIGEVLEVEVAI